MVTPPIPFITRGIPRLKFYSDLFNLVQNCTLEGEIGTAPLMDANLPRRFKVHAAMMRPSSARNDNVSALVTEGQTVRSRAKQPYHIIHCSYHK